MLVLEMKDGFSAETRARAYDIQMATAQGKKIKVCLWTRSSLAVACRQNTNSQASFNKTVALSYLDVYHLCQQRASVLSGGPVWLTYVACMRILARFLFSLHLILPQRGYNAEQMIQPRCCCVGTRHSTCFNDIIVKGPAISNVKKMQENESKQCLRK